MPHLSLTSPHPIAASSPAKLPLHPWTSVSTATPISLSQQHPFLGLPTFKLDLLGCSPTDFSKM